MNEKELMARVLVRLPELPAGEQEKLLSLTPREVQVLALLARRLGYREIARELSISGYTVRAHEKRIAEKLGVGSKMDVLLWAQKAGLLEAG